MLNNQKPEPKDKGSGSSLSIVEIFHTLQGEGPFTGYPSVFVRLAGCNLQCPACDTIYTGPARVTRPVHIIAQQINMLCASRPKTRLVVITGGEPLRQNIAPLVWKIVGDLGLFVQIETNGILPLPEELMPAVHNKMLHVVVSPKTSAIHNNCGNYASAFKYVISHDNIREEDGLPIRALDHKAYPFVARPPTSWKGPIFVNPCDSKDDRINKLNMQAVVASAMTFGYIAGIQCHKLWNLP